MERNADAILHVDYCNGIVPSSGAIGDPESWAMVCKAASEIVVPITLIIDAQLDPMFTGGVGAAPPNFLYQTDLRLRWSDDKGGGEALLDAVRGLIVTVGGGWVELSCNHKSIQPVGGAPGAAVHVSVTALAATIPHPRPVRSQRVDLPAGATTARLQIPRYTYLSRVECVPEITPQIMLRGYQGQAAAAVALQEVSGRNPLVNMSGIDFVDVQNTSPINRTGLVIHELMI